MTSCPKCGGMFVTVKYITLSFGWGEALRYTCGRCGYGRMEPCNDAKRADPPVSQEPR